MKLSNGRNYFPSKSVCISVDCLTLAVLTVHGGKMTLWVLKEDTSLHALCCRRQELWGVMPVPGLRYRGAGAVEGLSGFLRDTAPAFGQLSKCAAVCLPAHMQVLDALAFN